MLLPCRSGRAFKQLSEAGHRARALRPNGITYMVMRFNFSRIESPGRIMEVLRDKFNRECLNSFGEIYLVLYLILPR